MTTKILLPWSIGYSPTVRNPEVRTGCRPPNSKDRPQCSKTDRGMVRLSLFVRVVVPPGGAIFPVLLHAKRDRALLKRSERRARCPHLIPGLHTVRRPGTNAFHA